MTRRGAAPAGQKPPTTRGAERELLRVGLDIGSTTVKAVALDAGGAVVWKRYERHNAWQRLRVLEFFDELERTFGGVGLGVYTTGSGGRAIAPLVGGRYVQEVNAVTYAVERLCPDVSSVVELGGQDAKVIIWKEGSDGDTSTLTYMNDKCAGGTGATLDKIFSKIGLSSREVGGFRATARPAHHVAAKCGVFAETDVVGLIKSGVSLEEIVVSLCGAIVQQNLEVLVRGNILRDRVLLLGGPHVFLPVLADLWRQFIPATWKAHGWTPREAPLEELISVPADAEYFAAHGAILLGEEMARRDARGGAVEPSLYPGRALLEQDLREDRLVRLMSSGAARDGLVASEEEAERFGLRHAIPPFTPPQLPRGTVVRAFIGLDGGSTSTKLALIDEAGELLYRDYTLSGGNPIGDARSLFARLGRWVEACGLDLTVVGAAVTGYASEILTAAFAFDLAVVETVAHMRAAARRYGDVDVVCDVGGQDIKVLFLRNGRVIDFRLNTQCSAGNGSLLQGMAEQFGIPIEDYAAHAFRARKAPAFNPGCAVFLEQDRVNFQQLGWTNDEIMAGLALVLPLNIWNHVVQESNLSRLGRRFVLQGGTQRNLAAVKAQVDYIQSKVPGAEVFVHEHADLGGALGAALEALLASPRGASAFIGLGPASRVSYETRSDSSTRCGFCSNRCPRTFVEIRTPAGATVTHVSGFSCDKGRARSVEQMRALERTRCAARDASPNLVQHAADEAFGEFPFEPYTGRRWRALRAPGRGDREARARRAAMVVGIPRVLNLYVVAPFFSTYLRCLGVGRVVFSAQTSRALWEAGNTWGSIDPCFPAKVAPAHVADLLAAEPALTHVCFPMVTHLGSWVDDAMGNNACPIQMGTPEVVHAAFTRDHDVFAERGVDYWKPLVNLERPSEAAVALYRYFKDRLGVSWPENEWAVRQGYAALDRYLGSLRAAGAEVLGRLVERDAIGILAIGHPYHHDPGLNHGILEELQLRGFPILAIESLPVDDAFLDALFEPGDPSPRRGVGDVWRRNFNRNISCKLWAAKIAARHPNLAVVDLSSFKCGFDAPSYSYVDAILDAAGTPHFLFHDLDQNRPKATFGIRIQTIEYFLKLEERQLRERSRGHEPET